MEDGLFVENSNYIFIKKAVNCKTHVSHWLMFKISGEPIQYFTDISDTDTRKPI